METVLFREKFFDWPVQRNSPTMRKNNYNPLNKDATAAVHSDPNNESECF
jgi:hypothetical protein